MRQTLSLVVADDDPDILRLLERRLARRGYAVRTAPDGRAALDAIRRSAPDAVVIDRLMPAMTGVEGFGIGADDYLTKPFDLEELDDTLRRLIAAAGAGGQPPPPGR